MDGRVKPGHDDKRGTDVAETADDAAADARRAMLAVRERIAALGDDALDLILREARSMNGFVDRPVGDDQLRRIHDLMKMGPTSGNCSPARILFLRFDEVCRIL